MKVPGHLLTDLYVIRDIQVYNLFWDIYDLY